MNHHKKAGKPNGRKNIYFVLEVDIFPDFWTTKPLNDNVWNLFILNQ